MTARRRPEICSRVSFSRRAIFTSTSIWSETIPASTRSILWSSPVMPARMPRRNCWTILSGSLLNYSSTPREAITSSRRSPWRNTAQTRHERLVTRSL